MKRLKTFLIYALLIAAFWIFSDIIIYLTINGTYKSIRTDVYVTSPQITVDESKATYVNGFIKGSIKNNTQEIINQKYLKIDMYSPRGINLGTKYVKLENLNVDQSQEFEMWYQFTDVSNVIVKLVDNAPEAAEEDFISQEITLYVLFGKLMFLYFMI